jgi:hypothetical protein
MIRTLILGFTFILFSTVLLAVYVYTPEAYETLATDAGNISSIVIEEVQERIPVTSATLEEVALEVLSGTTTQFTLADLLKSENSYHCTVALRDNDATHGTVLTGSGQARAVFNREIGSRTTQTHVLYNERGMYVWNDGQNGLYFTTNTSSDILSDIHDLEYICEQTTLGSDIFALPEELTFYTR